ncbi:MAG: cob(I)yrinic acid a,c-diamide adenosyltransferase [Spirochaetes bacterium]|nr:cob(I)yrinic acid a,c-diamide adenosyltransferase [Spirochaetota bacterium]
MIKGLIQVYEGNGKGKTTAAIGTAIRAAGHGLKTIIFHFFKSEQTGEASALMKFKDLITSHFCSSQRKFIYDMNETEKQILKDETIASFNIAKALINNKKADIFIFDEISYPLNNNFISMDNLLKLLKNKPENIEIILTGRDMPEEIIQTADLVTEMKKIKHPFDVGIKSRKGFDY